MSANNKHISFQFILLFYLVIFCTFSITVYADNASKLNKRGIEAYNKQDTEESVQHFTDALVERPDSPQLRFNRGTALSASGKTEDAISELDRAATEFDSKDLSAAALFNAGNTFLASGDLDQAIERYKQAVKLDQSSKDIRHNLELALKKKSEQQQQQQQNKDQEQKNKDQEKNDKKDDQEQDQQDKSDKENKDQDQKDQGDENKSEQDEEKQSPPQTQTEQPMTSEEAKRILDAMDDEEKKALEKRKMIMQEAARQGDDW